MIWFDVAVAVVVAFNIFRGLRKGLIMEVISLVGIAVALWMAADYWDFVSPFWNFIPQPLAVQILSFLTVFVLTYLLFFILGAILKGAVRRTLALGWLDILGGGLLGGLEAWIPISLLYNYLVSHQFLSQLTQNSVFTPLALDTARWIFQLLGI